MAEQRTISGREREALELIERVRGKPARFRDAQVTMAHGAGGKASRTLIEGLFVPELASEPLAELDAPVESDTRPLWPAVDALLDAVGPSLRAMRDATRGGIATVLNELARASGVAITVSEARVPVQPQVAGAWGILGIDAMYVANEGTLVAFVAPNAADEALAALRSVPGCERASEIGEVRTEPPGMVLVETAFGGRRVMDLLVGDPL